MAETTEKPEKVTKKIVKKPAIKTDARLKLLFNEKYTPELLKELKLKNVNEVPKLSKIVVNVGLGKAREDKKLMEIANNTLAKITGQKPTVRASKVSIATFKLREGDKIGTKVTLRGEKMYEFAQIH